MEGAEKVDSWLVVSWNLGMGRRGGGGEGGTML